MSNHFGLPPTCYHIPKDPLDLQLVTTINMTVYVQASHAQMQFKLAP